MPRLIFSALLILGLILPAHAAREPARGVKLVELQIPGQGAKVLYSKSYALVIGASDYTNGWPKLPGVKDDTQAVTKALEAQGFGVTLLNNPDGLKLYSALKRFIGQYGQDRDNRLLIYFAGHGYTLKPDAERQLGYLVPVDAPLDDRDHAGFVESALSMETLEGLAKQIQSKHALFVFDACFSGSFFKMRAAPEAIALKTTQPVRQFITSGSADQQVPDVSVFRKQFVGGINGEADLNRDGYVTGSELGSFLEDTVTNYSRRTQTPQYGKIRERGLDQGDFVFQLAKVDDTAGWRIVAGPAAPKPDDLDLGDLARDDKVRSDWKAWQAKMQAAFDKVKGYQGSADNQAKAWARFLAAYPQDNPYSDDDERLRTAAQQAKSEAEKQPTRVAMATPPQSLGTARAGQTFKDCADCPEMMVIPAGSFDMGSSDGRSDEKPVHRVSISKFALGKTEVTNGEYRKFRPDHRGGDYQGNSLDGDDQPVVNVSWEDANAYVDWLSRKTGQRYRLPSEAEWEYAARAGTASKWIWSGDENGGCQDANLADQSAKSAFSNFTWASSCRDGYAVTAPVGRLRANSFGLYDMIGNVWEWTEDCYHDSYSGAPTDGEAWTSGRCDNRVLRGASWYYKPTLARSAYRIRYSPGVRSNSFGFRLARTY